jgi:hypothetical protein
MHTKQRTTNGSPGISFSIWHIYKWLLCPGMWLHAVCYEVIDISESYSVTSQDIGITRHIHILYVCEPRVHLHILTHSLKMCKFKYNYLKNLKIKFTVQGFFYVVQAWRIMGKPIRISWDSRYINYTVFDPCKKQSLNQSSYSVHPKAKCDIQWNNKCSYTTLIC